MHWGTGCITTTNSYPTRKEASKVKQFSSCHYQKMGLNVQGLVDCHLHFIYAEPYTGGRSIDYKVYQKS
jgi:hypothetical protein